MKWAIMAVALLLIAGGILWHDHRARVTRAWVAGLTRNQMRRLEAQISLEAASNPTAFLRAVGAGLLTDSICLPHLFPGLSVDGLTDPVGQPFHVRLWLVSDPSSSAAVYQCLIWTDGPNRVNEVGRGDDISLRSSIACPPL